LFIAENCPPLATDALLLAVAQLKLTKDVNLYKEVVQLLHSINPNLPESQPDNLWVDTTWRTNKATTDRLEAELKNYKTNLIKESIRLGHNDLAAHYTDIGDLQSALKTLVRSRDFCTTSGQVVALGLDSIKVALKLGNYAHCHSQVSQIMASTSADDSAKALCNIAETLYHFEHKKYDQVVRLLVKVELSRLNEFSDIISVNDVALITTLCALATLSRSAIKTGLLDDTNFRLVLETEPKAKQLLDDFYASRYSLVMKSLEEMHVEFALNLLLASHMNELNKLIRRKAILQFLHPYSQVSITSLAQNFNSDIAIAEADVVAMIEEGVLDARIDKRQNVIMCKVVY
jgi:COP9 signalosome complex subunit 1